MGVGRDRPAAVALFREVATAASHHMETAAFASPGGQAAARIPWHTGGTPRRPGGAGKKRPGRVASKEALAVRARAQFNLGLAHWRGRGVEDGRCPQTAVEWYKLAAQNGEPLAMVSPRTEKPTATQP